MHFERLRIEQPLIRRQIKIVPKRKNHEKEKEENPKYRGKPFDAPPAIESFKLK
jgi:hypothetical protein